MSEYLSKEEVKQWRSSLEKITLEEYAARLGKVIEEEKQTNDLVDIVLKGQPVMSKNEQSVQSKGEKINSIAKRTFEREREIAGAPFSLAVNDKNGKIKAEEVKLKNNSSQNFDKNREISLKEEVNITFKKVLTEREKLVFNHFLENKNNIVYAKDLARLLDLPRDYVYKYIKNLRAKIEGDKLKNAENGGYLLSV